MAFCKYTTAKLLRDLLIFLRKVRNVYTLFDYGNFMEDTDDDVGSPFIQLLSTTNMTQAHETFVQIRLNGVDTTGASSQYLLPASQEQHSPETKAEKKAQ